eukprot:CAMPEP_0183294056 /NCGR_PEP_ID=MMETSP0160_2-20130417/2521_1 /TAXON_ID=2839 ORGANISM="Odontella Sinensis, Strain Grunow 1884" /NCGR_SAMPLE_ID=MMETSP0160_2 /ASSEMBLY_ACC=CAM_ASM_000250 /LENGTH=252 /DNA_ID=CAMNT_0025455287 /DNA_START=241 /DNA_END=999 /DNA_ORIENTATION=+
MKLSSVCLLALVASGSAFQPAAVNRAFVARSPAATSPLFMAEEEAEAAAAVVEKEEEAAPAPAPAAAAAAPSEPAGALVPIKEETVEFTAGLLGGIAGFAVGGPILGAIGAAIANYASKTDEEVGEVVSAVSKSAIETWNYLSRLDAKYEVLNKAKGSLEDALDKVKKQDNVDPETVAKVEGALKSTTDKINEINEEYDLVGAASTALGVVGDLVEKAVKKAGELNSEYDLTNKAKDSLSKAVDKAKAAAKE